MKNISYENLSFLYDLISTDLKIATIKSNNGFTTTKINNVKQNNNLSFENEDVELFRIGNLYTFDEKPFTNGHNFDAFIIFGVGIILGDDLHMFGFPCNSSYILGDRHIVYHFNTNTFECIGNLPQGFYRGSGYRSTGGGNMRGTTYNASVVYYNQKFHMFYSAQYGQGATIYTNKHYILNYNEEDDYTLVDNPPMANSFFDYNTKAIVYNGKIHFFKYDSTNSVYSLLHYTYDEMNGYTELSPLPFYVRTKNMNLDDIIIYHDKIHFPISKINGDSEHIYHFTWDDTNGYRQIEQYTTAPEFSSDVFIYNDKIYMVNLASSNESTCIWDETNGLTRINNTSFYNSQITSASTSVDSNFFFEYNNELYYVSGADFYGRTFIKWNHGEWSFYRNVNYYLET